MGAPHAATGHSTCVQQYTLSSSWQAGTQKQPVTLPCGCVPLQLCRTRLLGAPRSLRRGSALQYPVYYCHVTGSLLPQAWPPPPAPSCLMRKNAESTPLLCCHMLGAAPSHLLPPPLRWSLPVNSPCTHCPSEPMLSPLLAPNSTVSTPVDQISNLLVRGSTQQPGGSPAPAPAPACPCPCPCPGGYIDDVSEIPGPRCASSQLGLST